MPSAYFMPWGLSVLFMAVMAGGMAVENPAGTPQPGMRAGGGPAGPPPFLQFDTADANHDGKVVLDEFSAGFLKFQKDIFSGLDANGDGFLTKEEMEKDMPPPSPKTEGTPEGTPPSALLPNPPMASSGLPGGPSGKPPVDTLDANKDGKLSIEEFTGAMRPRIEEMFKRFDTDGNGSLNSEEMSLRHGPKRGPRPGPAPEK